MSVSRGLGAAAPGLGSPAKSPGGEGQKPHIFSRASWRPPMEPHHIPTHSKEPVTARGADSCSDQEAVCRPAATGISWGGSAPVPSPGKAHPIETASDTAVVPGQGRGSPSPSWPAAHRPDLPPTCPIREGRRGQGRSQNTSLPGTFQRSRNQGSRDSPSTQQLCGKSHIALEFSWPFSSLTQ